MKGSSGVKMRPVTSDRINRRSFNRAIGDDENNAGNPYSSMY